MMCVFFSQKEAAISESETRSLPCVLFCAAIFSFLFRGSSDTFVAGMIRRELSGIKGKKKKRVSRECCPWHHKITASLSPLR